MKRFDDIRKVLARYGQEHLLDFVSQADEEGKAQLLSQLQEIDFAELNELISGYVLCQPKTEIPDDLKPAEWFPRKPAPGQEENYRKAEQTGKDLLSGGKVAFLTVAGGQGTRLGFDGPKGTYPIGPVTGRTLFEYFAGTIKSVGRRYGVTPVWYIMTSVINREATESFFRRHDYFGLGKDGVFFFTQGSMPAIGLDGKLLLASPSSLALSPNGHGGTLLALRKSGALDKMKRDGVEVISYFQVDNPLAPLADPLFIGMHRTSGSDMSAIALIKTGPMEKLGNFCSSRGRTMIIEYSDLPKELAEKRRGNGELFFAAGSPAIHVISREFIEKLTCDGTLKLPWHRADKKIPHLDAQGNLLTPDAPNGVKLESFIFDALPLAEKTLILEGDRAECFAPTKNPTGVDSVESCRAMLIERDARRLEQAGVKVARDAGGKVAAALEISPAAALDAEDVKLLVRQKGIVEVKALETLVLE